MKFELLTSPYEENISKIFITNTNEETDTKLEIPFMLIQLKNPEAEKKYLKTLKMCLQMNDASLMDGLIKPSEAFNFKADIIVITKKKLRDEENKNENPNKKTDKTENMLQVSGNIFKALNLMVERKLLSEYTCKEMIFGDEDQNFLDFLKNNENFSFKQDQSIEQDDLNQENISRSDNLFFSETNTPINSTLSSQQNSTHSSTNTSRESTPGSHTPEKEASKNLFNPGNSD